MNVYFQDSLLKLIRIISVFSCYVLITGFGTMINLSTHKSAIWIRLLNSIKILLLGFGIVSSYYLSFYLNWLLYIFIVRVLGNVFLFSYSCKHLVLYFFFLVMAPVMRWDKMILFKSLTGKWDQKNPQRTHHIIYPRLWRYLLVELWFRHKFPNACCNSSQ